MKNLKNLICHLLLFVAVELLLVYFVFHELPTMNFFTWLGIGHVIYFISLPFFGWWRIKSKQLISKIGATTLPLILHVVIHLVPLWDEMEYHHCHVSCNHYEEHNIIDIIILIVIVLVCGEYFLHRKNYRRV